MQRLINTVATSAAAIVLMAGLWQDWNLLTTLKRMFMGYLGFFFLGALMVLVIKVVPIFDKDNSNQGNDKSEEKKSPEVAA